MSTIINYSKINAMLLKEFEKGNKSKADFMLNSSEDCTWITEGHYMFKYYNYFFPFDTNKLLDNPHCRCFRTFNNPKSVIENDFRDYKTVSISCEKSIPGTKQKITVFTDQENTIEININSDFLKFINLDDNRLVFAAKSNKAPLYIMDIEQNNEVLGCILPIYIRN